MLLRCCLIHITIIISRHILYIVYLCPYLCLGVFMSYLLDLFFIFSPIFIFINHITSLNRRTCFLHIFKNIFYYIWMITWMKKPHNFLIAKLSLSTLFSFCSIFCQFQLGVAYKCIAYKKKRLS